MMKRGVKEDGVDSPTNEKYWDWGLFGGRPGAEFGSLSESCLLDVKVETWKGSRYISLR